MNSIDNIVIPTIALSIAIVSFLAGGNLKEKHLQREMAKAGVAEYRTDRTTGFTQFVILTNFCNHTN